MLRSGGVTGIEVFGNLQLPFVGDRWLWWLPGNSLFAELSLGDFVFGETRFVITLARRRGTVGFTHCDAP